MSFVAAASRIVKAGRADCFARFRDFAAWRAFMPPTFKPLKGPSGTLSVGDRLEIRIDAGPMPILAKVKIVRLEDGREITWRGGVNGVLVGEHSFFFDDEGVATNVRSEETWSGALAGVGFLARRIKKAAEQIGREQLEGFARDIEGV